MSTKKKFKYKDDKVADITFISLVAETRGRPNEAYAWNMDKTTNDRKNAAEQLSKMFDVHPEFIPKGVKPSD